MSDQGEGADRWRPASNRTDHSSDGNTAPLPLPADEGTDGQGFPALDDKPRLPAWALDDDGDPDTGEFPAVADSRAPFEPADPPDDVPSFGRTSFSSEYESSSFDPPSWSADDSAADGSFPSAGSFSAEDPPSFSTGFSGEDRPSFSAGSFSTEDPPSYSTGFSGEERSSFSTGFSSDESSSFSAGFSSEEPPSYSAEGRTSFSDEEPSRSFPSFSSEDSFPAFERKLPDPPAHEAEPKDTFQRTSKASAMPPAESWEQAEENEFFAQDDHPPVWDKKVAPSGPPPQPGKPSSGNIRMPDWMRDQAAGERPPDYGFAEDKGSRLPLIAGVALLVVGVLVVGGVYFMKNRDSGDGSNAAPSNAGGPSPSHSRADEQRPDKTLPRFKGRHTKAAGRVVDARAGLSYARLGAPWRAAGRKSPTTEIGFSQSQVAITQRAGGQPKWWGRLMSAQLGGAAKDLYKGPGTEKKATTQLVAQYEARLYGFRHKKRLLASQPITAGGHRGWLVGYYLTFHRPGVRATGDVMTVALVDTGRKEPGVLLMTVPNSAKRLYPDINYVVRGLKVA